MISIQEHIEKKLGIVIRKMVPVHGGDISQAWRIETEEAKYFLKVNDTDKLPGLFAKETRGLQALRLGTTISVPEALAWDVVDNRQYLLLQWIDKGHPQPDFWEAFGTSLAIQHQQEYSYFGWMEDNYIGSLPQLNTRHQSWGTFFTACRIQPLVKRLVDAGSFSRADMLSAEDFCKRADDLFPHEPPSLLHGDLWSGNYCIGSDGYAWIFDPAIYCGHREMDIGMTKLFGGFDEKFYKAYNQVYPIQAGWQERLPLAQLYPVLVHAVLFGGHYVQNALGIIKKFAAKAA